MEVAILELLEGAKQAKGLTVILDIFRAFSVAAYVMGNGAEKIIPVGAVEDAYALKERYPSAVLMGERGGKPLPGFDFGNSPAQIEGVDFRGRVVIQTTGAGTQGVVNASGATEILGGSFPTAEALVRYIRRRRPETVSLVAMGTRGQVHSDEDTLCAEYIRAKLLGEPGRTMEEIRALLRDYPSAKKFFDPANQSWAPQRDFELCLPLESLPFLLRLTPDEETGRMVFRKVEV